MDSTQRDTGLHITVATQPSSAPGTGLSFEEELRLIKAAILYADRAKLCSLSASFLAVLYAFADLDADKRWDALSEIESAGLDKSSIDQILKVVRELRRKPHKTKSDILLLRRVEAELDSTWNHVRTKIQEMGQEAGADGLSAAVEAGLLEIELYELGDVDVMVDKYIDSVGSAVMSGETFPLLDDGTGDLIQAAIKDGRFTAGPASIMQGRIAGLASEVLQRLPLFDEASTLEIIEIRRELDDPLLRFRSAVISYSRLIASAQWDDDFKAEADLVFREKVEPAVRDLEEAVEENSFARKLIGKATSSLVVPSTSVIGVILSEATVLEPLLGASLGVTVGATQVAGSARSAWRRDRLAVQRNQLYFYYRAGQMLDSTTPSSRP